MKEIVVISGKGGTGKTSVTAAFAHLAGEKAILADCDVDASNMHLVTHPEIIKKEAFFSGVIASINANECIGCGRCMDVCRFNAVKPLNNKYAIDKINCEGCGYCEKICPVEAITMEPQKSGDVYYGNTALAGGMVYAHLGIGAENSGKLVARVKQEAGTMAEERKKDIVLVDGSPGIGCPVVSSLSGAAYVVVVTEPSVSGFHDLDRVLELINKFHLPSGCLINKYDLNEKISNDIIKTLNERGVAYLGAIPYDSDFTKAIKQGVPVTTLSNESITHPIAEAWEKIIEHINN